MRRNVIVKRLNNDKINNSKDCKNNKDKNNDNIINNKDCNKIFNDACNNTIDFNSKNNSF